MHLIYYFVNLFLFGPFHIRSFLPLLIWNYFLILFLKQKKHLMLNFLNLY